MQSGQFKVKAVPLSMFSSKTAPPKSNMPKHSFDQGAPTKPHLKIPGQRAMAKKPPRSYFDSIFF